MHRFFVVDVDVPIIAVALLSQFRMAQKNWILYGMSFYLRSTLKVSGFLEVVQIYDTFLLSGGDYLHMSIDQRHLCLSKDHWVEVKSLTKYLLIKKLSSRGMLKDKKAKKYPLQLLSHTFHYVSLHTGVGAA